MTGTHSRLPVGERVDDLLDDPIGQLIMTRDGVTREDVLAVMTDMRSRLFGSRRHDSDGASKASRGALRLAA
ncbi:hypothetical protein CCP1ISM_5770002 [Azospirillaceae bacterium]